MTRTTFVSAIAALSLISVGVSIPSVSATELSGSHRNYNANRDYNYSDDKPAPRPAVRDHVDRDYDKDDTNNERRRHGDGWGGYRHLRRVEARASYASDYLPYHVREWRAKRSAIEAWKFKVSNLYGERFARWRMATEKQVSCNAGAGSVHCTVSARPERGVSRWSWYRDYDVK
jgi:hypothetical protein